MKAPGGDETSAEKALEVVVDEADAAPGGKARGAAGQMPVGPGVPCKDDGSGILWPAGRSCRSLHEHVLVHGNTDPSREAVIWLGDSGAVEGRRTYGDLLARARAVAYRLTKKYKVQHGDRVVLVLPPGLEFLDAFLGCLVAGVVAVPVYPPNPATIQKDLQRLSKIVDIAGVKLAITTSEFRAKLYVARTAMLFSPAFNAAWPKALTWQTLDSLAPAPASFRPDSTSGTDVAFLQFTSGSTSDPKGVMITHDNLLHNLHCMYRLEPTYQAARSMVTVNWMPQYHDMGLINMTLSTLYNCGTLVGMSPLSFLKAPLLWLEAISKYGANVTGGPNFSLVRCTKVWDSLPAAARPALRLATLRTLVCGAEPINVKDLEDFVRCFGPVGLPRSAVCPAYGLAEHTVFACCATAEDFFADQRGNVACGVPLPDCHFAIVNPESGCRVDAAGDVGEIWLSSPSVAAGYYGQPAVTEETFHARLPGSELRWLRTGDLGYITGNRLFVKGRVKDVIIVAGRNYYPQDVELTVQEASPAVRPGCVAVFSVPWGDQAADADDGGYIGIVAEVRDGAMARGAAAALCEQLRAAVASDHAPLAPVKIVLLEPRTVPKTTSGKIRRAECRARALAGKLTAIPGGMWNQTVNFRREVAAELEDVMAREQSSFAGGGAAAAAAAAAVAARSLGSQEKLRVSSGAALASASVARLPSIMEQQRPGAAGGSFLAAAPSAMMRRASQRAAEGSIMSFPALRRVSARPGSPPLAHASGRFAALAEEEEVALAAAAAAEAAAVVAGPAPPLADSVLVQAVLACLAEELGQPLEGLDLDKSLVHHGLGSLQAVRAAAALQGVLGYPVDLTALLQPVPTSETARLLAGGGGAIETIPARSVPEDVPTRLSGNQEQMLMLQTMRPESAAYNVTGLLQLDGALDVDVLQASLNYMARRHSVLRMVYSRDEQHQVLLPEGAFSVPLLRLDASHGPLPAPRGAGTAAAADAHLEGVRPDVAAALRAQAGVPFDVFCGPLVRAVLVDEGGGRAWLLLVLHHAVTDGWSMAVLMKEAVAAYNALLADSEPWLDPLPIQYADYAEWHDDHLAASGRLARELDYWRKTLAGAPPLLELPTDCRRPPTSSGRGARVEFEIPGDVATTLRRVASEHGATLFMALLAGFKALLARHAGADDVVVGTPSAGRAQAETQGLIGFFVNTLALRTDMSGDPAFTDLVRRVAATCLGAYANQATQFHKVVEALPGIARSNAYNSIFQVMFILQDSALLADMDMEGLDTVAWRRDFHTGAAKFDLTVELVEQLDGSVSGHLEYAKDLWLHDSAQRMVDEYRVLLAAAAAEPATTLAALPLLGAEEVHRLTMELPVSPSMDVPETTVHAAFLERWAVQTPDAPMLWFEGTVMTYRQVNERANRVAAKLLACGVRHGSPVGVLLPRSLDTLVCYFGAMKAGGCYVPLDPEYPLERLEMMVEDAAPPVVLSSAGMLEKFGALGAGTTLLVVDRDWDAQFAALPATDPAVPDLGPDSLAYMIFTSGSTGRPKGTMLGHRGLLNLVTWAVQRYSIVASDRCLTKAPFAFDMSVQEIFMPFGAGGSLAISKPDGHRDTLYLKQTIEAASVTFCRWVPSPLDMFLDELTPGECPSLTRVIVGGETMRPELTAKFGEKLPHATLINQYGPTEATVGCCSKTFEPKYAVDHPGFISYPIGRPVHNMRLYVLDARLQPCPVGVPGELHISGPQLAHGYMNRPDVTAEKFIPNPYAGGEARYARMYKSGDLVRWMASGDIQYVGRNDCQVKIRGFRIELGEVEAAVGAAPGVAAAVAAVEKDASGQGRLVAFVTPEDVDAAAVMEALRAALPDHMVPQMVVPMAEFPTLPNGKVNRRGFPAVDWSAANAAAAGEYVAPKGELQTLIQQVWTEVLGLETPVSATADFFTQLGGTSMLAGKANNMLRTRLGVQIAGTLIFSAPTVVSLAAAIERDHGADVMGGPDEELMQRLSSRKHGLTTTLEHSVPSRQTTVLSLLCAWACICLTNLWTFYGMVLGLLLGVHVYIWYPSPTGFEAALAAPAIVLAVFCFMTLGSLLCKWVVLGRVTDAVRGRGNVEGATGRVERAWGFFYYRWLAVRMFQVDLVLMWLPHLRGSELYNWYLRALGAKIGRNVVIETIFVTDFDLIRIGDDVVIERDAVITPSEVTAPRLRFGAPRLAMSGIEIGDGCTIGARAQVPGGTRLAPGTVVLPGRSASDPAALSTQPRDHARYRTFDRPVGVLFGAFTLVFCMLLTLTSLMPLAAVIGAITRELIIADQQNPTIQALGINVDLAFFMQSSVNCCFSAYGERSAFAQQLGGEMFNLICVPTYDNIIALVAPFPWLIVVITPLTYFLILIAAKWMLVGRFAEGCRDRVLWRYRVHLYSRMLDSPMYQLGARVWSGTFVIKLLLQALGASIGRGCWISFVTVLETDLLRIGDNVSIGGNGYMCASTVDSTQPVTIEADSDVTNSVTIYPGVTVREGGLLGDMTVAPPGTVYKYGQQVQGDLVVKAGTDKRPDGDGKAARASAPLYHLSLFLCIAVVLPVLAASFILPLVVLQLRFMVWYGFPASVGFFPVALTTAYAAMMAAAITAKFLIRRSHVGDHPFYSLGHFRWELLRIMFTSLIPVLERLRGTAAIVWFYRGLGARIGKDVAWFGGDRVEMDLLMVGDYSVTGDLVVMDGHTIEARVLQHEPTALAPYTTLCARSGLLMGASTEEFSELREVSLLMKGETMSRRSVWAGVPSRPVGYNFDPSVYVEQAQERQAETDCRSFVAARSAASLALRGRSSLRRGSRPTAARPIAAIPEAPSEEASHVVLDVGSAADGARKKL